MFNKIKKLQGKQVAAPSCRDWITKKHGQCERNLRHFNPPRLLLIDNWKLGQCHVPLIISAFVNLKQEEEKWKCPTVVNKVLWESADFIGIWTLWSWWITHTSNHLCAYFFKTLINCYHVGWQDFAILKHMFERAQRSYPFDIITNMIQSNNELEAWQEFWTAT